MDRLKAKTTLRIGRRRYAMYALTALERDGVAELRRLPYSIRILLENLVRHLDGRVVGEEDVLALARWAPHQTTKRDIPFHPGRVVLQDFTGVPVIVDMAAMRDAMRELGCDPGRINPVIPVDLVIDHSLQVDFHGVPRAEAQNVATEYSRNMERYRLLRWAQGAFNGLRVFPPGAGIVHQVNLEYLARVVDERQDSGEVIAFPDTLVGTDSHTPMINALGVLGWGVGGIEAEAVMLGQPYAFAVPEVVGVRLEGSLGEGVTATDLVLHVTHLLRKEQVVEKFVEFFGPGLSSLAVPERATIANMAPEYGATVGFFPVDDQVLRYMELTHRGAGVPLVEAYCREQKLFYDAGEDPEYTKIVPLNLAEVEPLLAGPSRPQDKVGLSEVRASFAAFQKSAAAGRPSGESGIPTGLASESAAVRRPASARAADGASEGAVSVRVDGRESNLSDGSVVIAALTSCTNTSNPDVMVAAGLLAKKAVDRGLGVPAHVKTSMAPGSRVVTAYLTSTGLLEPLEKLGFGVVGYGCTTCIGNSGPLDPAIETAIRTHGLTVAAVLSGNRNFEARIHSSVKANYLASPPLVVAYALAGRVDLDMRTDPLGTGSDGSPVFLRDLWPTSAEIDAALHGVLTSEMFRERYKDILRGGQVWEEMDVAAGALFAWDAGSTYIRRPPYFDRFRLDADAPSDIRDARILLWVGDSVTTDHISPAGNIDADSPAGRYLLGLGVAKVDFNAYGTRRGNHDVMIRGTFANVRLKNKLVAPREGGFTKKFPAGEAMTVFDAATQYAEEGVSLVVLAGKEYGTGSSRDWAAKGTALLGVRAVIAGSYERIHRANLIGMGVLPLEFHSGESAGSLGLRGDEALSIDALSALSPGASCRVHAEAPDGRVTTFTVVARLDTPAEIAIWRGGGLLPHVLRSIAADSSRDCRGDSNGSEKNADDAAHDTNRRRT